MIRIALWPRRFVGRLTIVFVAAMLFQLAGGILFHDQVDRLTLREDHARRIAELLVVGDGLLTASTPERTAEIMRTLSTSHLRVSISDQPITASTSFEISDVAKRIVAWEPTLARHEIRLSRVAAGRGMAGKDLVGSMRLANGRWLEFRSRDLFGRWPLLYRTLGMAVLLSITLVVCAAVLINALAAPLRAIATAAHHVGAGAPVSISERGPPDLVEVARAFNTMQGRIARLIADRSMALAAVSHDLRTPLSRLRLRAERIDNPDLRQTITGDVIEMQEMVDSVLALIRGDSDPEDRRQIDLASSITTLVNDEADAGHELTYEGPDHLPCTVRPLALRRALRNLIVNGLQYGRRVRVGLSRRDGGVCITVDDDGPGIAEADIPLVTEPFVRLDSARRRNTAGLGLGLSVAARVAEREGGALRLSNRPEGGLRAEVFLPG